MQRSRRPAPLALLFLFLAAPALAKEPLQQRVEAKLAEAGPGPRFGLVVADADGRELIAINPDQRFIPASNTKIFTTAAAFAILKDLDQPDQSGGASVRLEGKDVPDVVLRGHGDARLSSAPDCVSDCLATLADAVAARTKRVRDVVGDDSLFPDERWSPGMSWNNIVSRYGTGISALTLDDNELAIRVVATSPGAPPKIELLPYYDIDNRAVTVASGETALSAERMPNSRLLRLSGTIAAGAEPEIVRVGIDDPAHFAAWRFKALLEARGVRVTGKVDVRHRPLGPGDDPKRRGAAPIARPAEPEALARLTPPPVTEDLVLINKVSQNLHAELMLRRVALVNGTGSIADGVAALQAMLERAGVPRTGWDFSDGSGMSTYNRVAPRTTIRLLRWIAAQPWGTQWRQTLPVGGVDGTLGRRFRGTPLQGKVFAKTGTINATNALSGYLTARSGRTLTFSAYANDVPEDVAATRLIDAALVLVAEEN
ncbi:D-alanyl-D-alanine carboxypeptidase/D-alanyl-D-alanine-endopeptidase [Sphingosinicella sp. BN140058]|uniref:D-alanyl-D-alanine carboxypeptidase/D-alanyl-D-alanine endopeptidase n=1 Tax=Sphingosinicella sp. BN140058 TaxID=1892855 RepID=UPI0010137B9A|nr:D-alanyl-D-alanine carboxypeptidase/D-alanyl-D-alanine-endopeptidase [Sphingosinicella sp. BN140058]QAY76198.1 D-alanyl-D-alanine carboxypeptidase/D-alanyl-D-alanine-endopeptidase [Sphingosinicella sp. BN140058]